MVSINRKRLLFVHFQFWMIVTLELMGAIWTCGPMQSMVVLGRHWWVRVGIICTCNSISRVAIRVVLHLWNLYPFFTGRSPEIKGVKTFDSRQNITIQSGPLLSSYIAVWRVCLPLAASIGGAHSWLHVIFILLFSDHSFGLWIIKVGFWL